MVAIHSQQTILNKCNHTEVDGQAIGLVLVGRVGVEVNGHICMSRMLLGSVLA